MKDFIQPYKKPTIQTIMPLSVPVGIDSSVIMFALVPVQAHRCTSPGSGTVHTAAVRARAPRCAPIIRMQFGHYTSEWIIVRFRVSRARRWSVDRTRFRCPRLMIRTPHTWASSPWRAGPCHCFWRRVYRTASEPCHSWHRTGCVNRAISGNIAVCLRDASLTRNPEASDELTSWSSLQSQHSPNHCNLPKRKQQNTLLHETHRSSSLNTASQALTGKLLLNNWFSS